MFRKKNKQSIMKTKLTLLLASSALALIISQCTNTQKNDNIIIKEKIIIKDTVVNDTPLPPTITNNELCNTIWEFYSVNGNNINNYIYENIPYIVLSNDSSYILINGGCNLYIGECSIENNNEIKFNKIRIKDESCPIEALEREIIYALTLSNNYSLNNSNLTLFNNNTPTAFLIMKNEIINK